MAPTTPSTQNAPTGSSSTQKSVAPNTSSHTAHGPAGSPITEKSSTIGPSTTRISTLSGRSTTQRKPASVSLSSLQSNPPSVPSTSAADTSTTRRIPIFSVYSPGGNHPNYSTILPPISQGQHGATSGDGDGANTSTIIAGVIVPLILIGVVALAVYIWYRRKYPVRMVLGRDFNRFSNPAYSKRASTVTLVKKDEQKDWDTLCRRNPDLSVINEDGPDGVENLAFEYENEEDKEINSDVKIETDIKASTTSDIENSFEEESIQNAGIRRERPKTKRAILVKTSTMDDFENGFELVTESDLGQRTESEVSSGNDSTETHTISLTFSETFDDRHKPDRSNSDMSEVKDTGVISVENNDLDGTESPSLNSASEETNGEYGAVQGDNALDETDMLSSQSNESFEIVRNKQDTDTLTVQEEQDDIEMNIDTLKIPTEELGSGNKSEMQLNVDKSEDSGNFNEMKFVETSNSALPLNNVGNVSETKINKIEHQENIPVNKNFSTDTALVEMEDGLRDSLKQEGETEEELLDKLKHATNFYKLSDSEEDKAMNINKRTKEGEINVLEKEKTEVSEKDEISVETNEIQAQSFIDIEGPATSDSQNVFAQRKMPPLQLSNENIVLDSDPKSPTLVQESFILENESPLPVYLDSTHMSPRRGRRAFTLNDIASKHTTDTSASSAFSLPKLNDEKSKSSPVISEMKTPNFVFKQFEFDSKRDDVNHSNEDHMENNEIEILKTYADKSIEQKQCFDFNEYTEASTINYKKDSQSFSNIFDSTVSVVLQETHLKKDFSSERDEPVKSLDNYSSEFNYNKSDYFDRENNLENNNFDDFTTDLFNLENADSKSGKEESTQPTVNIKDGSVGSLQFLNTADKTLPINNHVQEKVPKEVIIDERSTENNLFSGNFPQSSTPTTSFVVEKSTDQNEDVKRKKLMPQSFEFDNFDDTDSESSSSKKSSANSEILDSPTFDGILVEGFETFSKMDNAEDHIADKVEQQPVISFATDDMLSLTRSTDSSTALSWEVLSRENSQDSKSADHLDLTAENNIENVSGHLEDHANEKENNERFSVKSEMMDFNFSDMSKQSSAHDTSVSSSATTDISWELVNEEGDNSEC